MTSRDTTRGTCPECGQAVPLYRGLIRSHQQQATALRPARTCPGAMRKPGPAESGGQLALDTLWTAAIPNGETAS